MFLLSLVCLECYVIMCFFFKGNIDSGVLENFFFFTEGFGVGGVVLVCVWVGFFVGIFFFLILGFFFFGLVLMMGVLGCGCGLV